MHIDIIGSSGIIECHIVFKLTSFDNLRYVMLYYILGIVMYVCYTLIYCVLTISLSNMLYVTVFFLISNKNICVLFVFVRIYIIYLRTQNSNKSHNNNNNNRNNNNNNNKQYLIMSDDTCWTIGGEVLEEGQNPVQPIQSKLRSLTNPIQAKIFDQSKLRSLTNPS